jgi:hypothetical protein
MGDAKRLNDGNLSLRQQQQRTCAAFFSLLPPPATDYLDSYIGDAGTLEWQIRVIVVR